ncbi:MAG: hypothetical protein AAB686_01885, partial [Patescibacteria group bacterium]
IAGENTSQAFFCQEVGLTLLDAQYCKLSTGGAHHFGCVSMKKGQYIIFNKQYTEREFEQLRTRIVEHMNAMPYTDKRGRVYKYGEFFPIEFSPFAYNETLVQNFFPLTPEKAEAEGYTWAKDDERKHSTTRNAADLPDHIKDASDDILNEVIGCAECERGFRVIKMELDLLRHMNVPLPRKCPLCRITEKFNAWVRNLTLFSRKCAGCGIDMQSKYTEAEALKVFCRKCYLAEIV